MDKPYELPDLREKTLTPRGETQVSDRRLYMQLQVYTGCRDPADVVDAIRASEIESVVYADATDPCGVGVLALSEDPSLFTGPWRRLLSHAPFSKLERRPALAMMGRTYSTGREPSLEFALFQKPRQAALNPEWPWAIWYLLRRRPEFYLLPAEQQAQILRQHAEIGMAFGAADAAHDIRLACFGLDVEDNEFVIALVGRELAPLSQCVQEMRKTVHTARYIERLGPFFVGRVLWQARA